MRFHLLLLVITCTATLFSCQKEKNQSAIVIRDCTGTYLRFDNKDYLVCNDEITNDFEENDKVIATYKNIEECKSNDAVCALYHKSEGNIKVCKIRED